ncbi:MAG: DUF3634 family protein [Deltaproteobacteria bacterium]|nr:DUF3634 family protein [Deltaproteobacteria bacterium]
MFILFLILAGIVIVWLFLRAGELFYISVRDGKLLVVRGRVPVSMLQEFRDCVRNPVVRRGAIKAFKTESGGQLTCSGDISEGREQRMRNTFMLYPASKLRIAPAAKDRTFGQLAGIAWLAWMLDRTGRH